MAIEVGKDVVAIENHSQGNYKKGQIFTCIGLRDSRCKCSDMGINIGYREHPGVQYCPQCNTSYYDSSIYTWYCISAFRAIDDITPSIEEIIKEIAPLELTQV